MCSKHGFLHMGSSSNKPPSSPEFRPARKHRQRWDRTSEHCFVAMLMSSRRTRLIYMQLGMRIEMWCVLLVWCNALVGMCTFVLFHGLIVVVLLGCACAGCDLLVDIYLLTSRKIDIWIHFTFKNSRRYVKQTNSYNNRNNIRKPQRLSN